MTPAPPAAVEQRTDRPAASTAEQLIDAAEKMVALHGEGGVSSRSIILEAGQRNNAAIDYYFGSRRGLLDAVWSRGTTVVDQDRQRLREQYGYDDLTLPQLVELYVRPIATHCVTRTPSYWARFNEDALRRYPLAIAPFMRQQLLRAPDEKPLHHLLAIFEEMEQHVLDGRSPASAARVSVAIRSVVSTLAAWERDAETGATALTATELHRRPSNHMPRHPDRLSTPRSDRDRSQSSTAHVKGAGRLGNRCRAAKVLGVYPQDRCRSRPATLKLLLSQGCLKPFRDVVDLRWSPRWSPTARG